MSIVTYGSKALTFLLLLVIRNTPRKHIEHLWKITKNKDTFEQIQDSLLVTATAEKTNVCGISWPDSFLPDTDVLQCIA